MKNQILICCAVYIMAAQTPASAQANDPGIKIKYERETIFLAGNSNKYCKNQQWRRIGIFGKQLDKEFENVTPETGETFHNYRRHRRKGAVRLIAGGVVLIATLVVLPVASVPVCIAAGSSGLALYSDGAFHIFKSQRGLQKAVWLRNRDKITK